MKIKILLIIIFAALSFNCNLKNISNNEELIVTDFQREKTISVFDLNYDIVYAAPFEGLILYSQPDFNSESIAAISRNTKLAVLEKINEKEVINGENYCWYKVDSGKITGWAFNEYLFDKPVPEKVKNLRMAKIIAGSDNIINKDNVFYFIENSIYYNNRDMLKIYENNSFESKYININNEKIFLFKYEELQGWYYLITNDCEKEGFIYIKEISNESFYGDPEKNAKSGNYYQYMQNIEYEIVKQHENIKRYGPLLSINHNSKINEFLDTRNGGPGGASYLIIDYYKNYDEILILKQYWEGISMSIYNLKHNEFRCENIQNPIFNNSRTYMVSFAFIEDTGNTIIYSIKLFIVNNGIYKEIYNEDININNSWKFKEVFWINEKTVCIDYGEKGNITIEAGNDIRIINNLPPMLF